MKGEKMWTQLFGGFLSVSVCSVQFLKDHRTVQLAPNHLYEESNVYLLIDSPSILMRCVCLSLCVFVSVCICVCDRVVFFLTCFTVFMPLL